MKKTFYFTPSGRTMNQFFTMFSWQSPITKSQITRLTTGAAITTSELLKVKSFQQKSGNPLGACEESRIWIVTTN